MSFCGCATQKLYHSPFEKPLNENEGIVLITINGGFDSFQWSSIVVKALAITNANTLSHPLPAAKEFVLFRTNAGKGANKFRFYSSRLPAGQYQITGVSDTTETQFHTSYSWVKFEENSELTFEIKANTITDLGRLLVYEMSNKDHLVAKINDNFSIYNFINQFSPPLAKKIAGLSLIGWKEKATSRDAKAVALARQNPKSLSEVYNSKRGRFLLGSQLGIVHEINKEGTINRIELDHLKTITSVSEYGEKGIVFGGYNNYLAMIIDSNPEKVIPFNVELKGQIADIFVTDKGNILVSTIYDDWALAYYYAEDINDPEWLKISDVKKVEGFLGNRYSQVFRKQEQVYIVDPEYKIHQVDLTNGNIETFLMQSKGNKVWSNDIFIDNNGTFFLPGDKTYTSSELSDGWQLTELNLNGTGKNYLHLGGQKFIREGETNYSTYMTQLEVSHNGGMTWSQTDIQMPFLADIIQLDDGNLMIRAHWYLEFISSSNFAERNHIPFTLKRQLN